MKRLFFIIALLAPLFVLSQSINKTAMMSGCVLDGDSDIFQKCKAVKEAGFDAIEVASHMDRDKVVAATKQYGLEIASVCCHTHWEYSLASADAQERAKGIEGLKVAIDDAAFYGTDVVLFVPGNVNEERSYDQCWDRSVAEIKKVVPYAESKNVIIAIENVWNNFLLSPLEAARYVDTFDSKNVGFYFDSGNISQFGWAQHWVKILGNRIKRVHIKEFDTNKSNDTGRWNGFAVALGEGTNNWDAIMKALQEIGYKSYLTVEKPCNDAASLKDMNERLNRIIKK